MKKVFLPLAGIIFSSSSFAQVQKIERPEIIKKLPATTTPSGLVQGKDLTIRIASFQLDPANGCAIHVNYVVKNNGTEAVDLNNVSVQAYLDDPQTRPTVTPPTYLFNGKYCYAAGGHALASFSTMLGPGQEKENTLHCFNLDREHYFNTSDNYTYTLVVDKANIIAEANENNNTAVSTFRGYLGQYPAALPADQYYLSNAFLILKTGADNKEKESEVNIRVIPSTTKNLTDTYNEFIKKVAKNETEFYSNASQTLPLGLFMSGTSYLTNPATSMAAFNQNGLGLVVEYKANFLLDAWKIEQAQLVLYFKDVNGLVHPTQGVKIITFNMPANTFLDGFAKHYLVCKTDNALNPVNIKVIEKLTSY
ncbi:CARDB domain-containing protein [Ferruginibacter sp.]